MARLVSVKTEGFLEAADQLRDAGRGDLRRELYRGLNRGVKGARQDVVAAMPGYMPSQYAGSLGSDFKITTSARRGRQKQSIKLRGSSKKRSRHVRAVNRGELRHPLFGNRGFWYTTRVTPGFWVEPLNERQPEMRREIEQAMADVADKIAS